jgi:ABC-2 type transport system permease protein
MFWKVTFSLSAQSLIKNIGSFIVFGSFAIGAFLFSRFLTAYLLQDVKIGLFLFHRFMSMLLFVFFITISLGNMVVSFSTLYRSPEVHFMLTKPIPHLTIFIIKFLDNFFYSSGTLFLAGFSVLLGYGSYFGFPWHFYLLVMLGVLVPFMFLAGCTAVIILLVLMKLASRISFKMLIGLLVLFYVAQIYFYFHVTSPIDLVREVMRYYPNVNLYFGQLDPPVSNYLPNFWISQILFFYATGKESAVVGYCALLILSSGAAFIALVLAGDKLFYSTWITSLTFKSFSIKKFEFTGTLFSFEKRSRFSPQTESILKKEYWQFLREPSQWIHLIVMLFLVFTFLSSVTSMDFGLQDPKLRTAVFLVVYIFDAFLITSIALRFAFPMMSLEGDTYWTIRSSPLRASKVYWTKFAIVLVPLAFAGLALAVLSNVPYIRLSPLPQVTTGGMVFIAFALVSLNFGLGSYFVNYDEKNPIRIASSQGATLTFLLSIVFLVVLVSVFFFPILAVFNSIYYEIPKKNSLLYYALGVIGFLSAVVGIVSHTIGIRALARDV